MYFDNNARFVISNYPSQKPFSSFLPGIAGLFGIPMWVFYTNRGQAISAFGVESKDSPIMEFQPANKAYQTTAYKGFRTFIKIRDEYYEPFSSLSYPHHPQRDMYISMNELEIQENEAKSGLQTNILYFSVTNEPFAGLVRQVTLKNTSDVPLEIELLDGMPAVVPYGMNDWFMKMMARTAEAWLEVFNMDKRVPFFRTRASIVDKSEVEGVEAGHFYLSFYEQASKTKIIRPIVDPTIIFANNTSLSYPDQFMVDNLTTLLAQHQVTVGKTPCAFFGTELSLTPGESFTLHSIIGHVNSVATLNRLLPRLASSNYLLEQRQAAQGLIKNLTRTVSVKTANPIFDAYTRQTFLDNVMRGGWPVMPGNDVVYHVYSRKHGDMERDYNAFFLAAEAYSQGNGNFRDVNQNRREDIWLNPNVKDFNIRVFVNLIQADGYNPLVLHGSRFTIPPQHQAKIRQLVEKADLFDAFSLDSFTLGELLKFIDAKGIMLTVAHDEFITAVCQYAEQFIETSFHEGYWVDHWTYNLDLIENYLGIYPEEETELLFHKRIFTYHDSAAVVRPRHEKHVLANGSPRQFEAVKHDAEKTALIHSRQDRPHVVRTKKGHGEIYYTSLISKLFCISIIKMATLDPDGMGIEMEADRPGWYDAINGLPGLFGSSMPESFELLRLLRFIKTAISKQQRIDLPIPIEVADLLEVLVGGANYWEVTATREQYREQIRFGFDGQERHLEKQTIMDALDYFIEKLRDGINRALELNDGLPPTYFRFHPTDYELLGTSDAQGRPHIRVKQFEVEVLPLFLEGPVRYLKIAQEQEAQSLYKGLRGSELFDKKLKMYKLNASLAGQPMDIGRARAFTPGWLENGSIWMHMAYKYLLALLKAGLYNEFFEAFRDGLIPFQDPKVYGRSILENSSFIASSEHPDASIHGQGFVARLSGSTAEFLSILHHMMIGHSPFYVENGEIKLALRPVLPPELFDDEGQIQFTFLGQCKVTYHNLAKSVIHDKEPRKIILHRQNDTIEIDGQVIGEPYAVQVRNGEITAIETFF